jgi:8-hydroxy-5-deazaflavin:NADPH oxidoreductase
MKIGILGTGDVGQSLAKGLIGLGHEVMIGSRESGGEKLTKAIASVGGGARGGTFAEAAAFGEMVALCCLGAVIESVVGLAGPKNLAGKVLIDATNPLDFSRGFPPRLSSMEDGSAGQMVQRLAPGARVVKAFNTAGNTTYVNPSYVGGPPDMFICGDDDTAKAAVAEICKGFGWGVIDLGGIEASHYLEVMCIVWVLHGARSGQWGHAFKMLH